MMVGTGTAPACSQQGSAAENKRLLVGNSQTLMHFFLLCETHLCLFREFPWRARCSAESCGCRSRSRLQFMGTSCRCDLRGGLGLALKMAFAEWHCEATCKNRTLQRRKNATRCHYLTISCLTNTVPQPASVSIPWASTKYTPLVLDWPWSKTMCWHVIYAVLNDAEME